MPRSQPEYARLLVAVGLEHRERFLKMLEEFGEANKTVAMLIDSSVSTIKPRPNLELLPKPRVDWITNQEGKPRVPVITLAAIGEFELAYTEETGAASKRFGRTIHRAIQGRPLRDPNRLFETCVVNSGKRRPVREPSQDELQLNEALRQEGLVSPLEDLDAAAAMTSSPDTLEVPPYTMLRADRVSVLADALGSKPPAIKFKDLGQKAIAFLGALGEAIDPASLTPPDGIVPPISMDTSALQYPV
jgi:hypothetical protein